MKALATNIHNRESSDTYEFDIPETDFEGTLKVTRHKETNGTSHVDASGMEMDLQTNDSNNTEIHVQLRKIDKIDKSTTRIEVIAQENNKVLSEFIKKYGEQVEKQSDAFSKIAVAMERNNDIIKEQKSENIALQSLAIGKGMMPMTSVLFMFVMMAITYAIALATITNKSIFIDGKSLKVSQDYNSENMPDRKTDKKEE